MTSARITFRPRRAAALAAKLLSRVFMAIVLALILAAIVVLMILPRATQGSALTVLTGSMSPGIPVGSVVFVRPVDTATLEVGDVATYQKEPGVDAYVTHRIQEIDTSTDPTSFVFKGDANRGADVDPVPATAIRGEVWFHVPYLGAIRDALNGKAGLSLLATLVLGGYAIGQVLSAIRERRRRGERSRQPAGATTQEELTVRTDRPLVLVELQSTGIDPETLAQHLGGIVLRRDVERTALLFSPQPEQVAATLQSLEILSPLSLRVFPAGDTAIQQASSPGSSATEQREEQHALA